MTFTMVCAQCGAVFDHEPVRDPEQVHWLGDNAQTFCTPECLDNAAEAAGMRAVEDFYS